MTPFLLPKIFQFRKSVVDAEVHLIWEYLILTVLCMEHQIILATIIQIIKTVSNYLEKRPKKAKKPCKCVSNTHQKISQHLCLLNMRWTQNTLANQFISEDQQVEIISQNNHKYIYVLHYYVIYILYLKIIYLIRFEVNQTHTPVLSIYKIAGQENFN